MVLDNLLHYHADGRLLDGVYISINSNVLLFESELSEQLCDLVTKAVKEELEATRIKGI